MYRSPSISLEYTEKMCLEFVKIVHSDKNDVVCLGVFVKKKAQLYMVKDTIIQFWFILMQKLDK